MSRATLRRGLFSAPWIPNEFLTPLDIRSPLSSGQSKSKEAILGGSLPEESFVQRCGADNSQPLCKILEDVSQRARLSTSQRSILLYNVKSLPAMKLERRAKSLWIEERVPR